MRTILIGLIVIFVFSTAYGQQQKKPTQTSYVDSLNRYYMQADLPVYISISNTPQGPTKQLSPSNHSDKVNEAKPIYLDGHGIHYLKHLDKLEVLDKFVIYADGKAPKTNISKNNSPKSSSNAALFFGKGLKISLSATDELSGVNQIYSSINQNPFAPYSGETSFDKEGDYLLQYYSVDNVGNLEEVNKYPFTVDLTPPKTYYHIVGIAKDEIISVSSRLYLTATDSIAGLANTYYHFDDQPPKRYQGGDIPIAGLTDGNHTLYFHSVDKVNNKETESSLSFYLDKTSPIMSADVLGDRFIVGDKVYYSGRTKLKLTAVDNKSGVKEILYSIDNSEFIPYEDPFYLPNKAGQHIVKYFAIDNVENQINKKKYSEYKHVVGIVFVDLTGPTLKNSFDGPSFKIGDDTYISGETNIVLKATDSESGLKAIKYILDGGEEKDYNPPLNITQEGKHKIRIVGYDNVNNRNVDDFEFIVDNVPSDIIVNYSVKPTESVGDTLVFPSYVSIYLACSDLTTDCKKISYSINNLPVKLYKDKLMGFEKNKYYEIRIIAEDCLRNKSEKVIKFKTNEH